MYPVRAGAMIPPTLPPKFWIPEAVPTMFFEHTAWVRVQVLGEASPSPQSDVANSQTDVILSSTIPAGTIKHAMAMPTAMNPFRTAVSRQHLRISQSLAKPASMMVTDIARNGTEL